MPKNNTQTKSDAEATTVNEAPTNDGFTELEKSSGELGSDQVQQAVDEAEEQGFIGVKSDPRDNFDYTVAGVTRDQR